MVRIEHSQVSRTNQGVGYVPSARGTVDFCISRDFLILRSPHRLSGFDKAVKGIRSHTSALSPEVSGDVPLSELRLLNLFHNK